MFINDVLTWGGGPSPHPPFTRTKGGGVAENDMLTRGRGVRISHKSDDVIYEQLLMPHNLWGIRSCSFHLENLSRRKSAIQDTHTLWHKVCVSWIADFLLERFSKWNPSSHFNEFLNSERHWDKAYEFIMTERYIYFNKYTQKQSEEISSYLFLFLQNIVILW